MPKVWQGRKTDKQGQKSLRNTAFPLFDVRNLLHPQPKRNAYSEDVREMAIKVYYAGTSGRSVGKVFGFSKTNVYNWLKKTEQ